MGRRRSRRYKRRNNNIRGFGFIVLLLILLIFINISLIIREVLRDKKEFNDNKLVASNLNENLINNNFEDIDEKVKLEDTIIDRLEEYESLIIIKDSHGISSIENIPKPLNLDKLKIDKNKEYILLYHTHSTEAFLNKNEDIYHSQNPNENVISIGRTLAVVLEANGHKVDHVETNHDLPSYNNSYSRSLNTINSKKAANSNLKVLLDIHRDGVDKDAPYRKKFLETARVDINGVSTATFSLVIGPDSANYDKLLSFAKYIKAVSDTLYPNLCTGIIIKPRGRYNLYNSDYSALIEVGSNLNTIDEAKESAKLVGEILSLVLDSIIE